MYKLTITGNFNVPIADTRYELTPSRPEAMITDDEFEQHKAYIEKLSAFVTYTKVNDTVTAKATVEMKVEKAETVKVETVQDNAIVDATGASSENPTAVKEAQKEADKDIVDATDASKKSATKQEEETQTEDTSTEEVEVAETTATKKKTTRRKKN